MTESAIEKNLFDEWASGISLANSESNSFFEEIPTELNNPASFRVDPNQIPQNPAEPVAPVVQVSQPEAVTPSPSVPEPQEESPEVLDVEGGGTVTLEKTNRGWKAALDCGEANAAIQNFYGANLKKLILNLAKAQVNATKAIMKLKKEKLLGGDEPPAPALNPAQRTATKATNLTPDDAYAIKNALAENPPEAFDMWLKKKFGLDPDQFAEALTVASEAKRIVDAQKVKAEVEEINVDFVRNNPDWNEDYGSDPSNIRKLIGRMSKAFLNKKITEKTPQATVDDTIYELYSRGFWTVENLETAKEELIDSGLLEKSESHRQVPQPQPTAPTQPQQVTPNSPPAPAERIAPKPGQQVAPVFGSSVRNTSSAETTEKALSDVDLYSLPLDQLRQIAAAQLKVQR